ncbi:DUF4276 family protein [Tenacibaculum aiptasiae]|uniref:DUF4276 family protein n=1 Tax=Tenacibaculum aiptasiae TaxID=426481 RepID=UPI00232B68E6|nr:DUF4276 family protein [Tenacibaculum aiptasiae]
MALIKNKNSILFLYEGETEKEFYKKIFDIFIEPRSIRINYGNLKGVYDLNNKVESKIKAYLDNKNPKEFNNINVFIAYDREGDRNTDTLLNLKELKNTFIYEKSRIKSIHEIVATQDLESWLFNDLDNIYSFLKIPNSKRNLKAYPNCEMVNNRTLSSLFHKNKKHYQKGKSVSNFINSLDLVKIYNSVPDLRNGITEMKKLYQ